MYSLCRFKKKHRRKVKLQKKMKRVTDSMFLSVRISQYSVWVFFFVFSYLFCFSLCDPRISTADMVCGPKRSLPPGSAFIPNFVSEMEILAELTTKQGSGYHIFGSSPTIYGLAQCFGDLSLTDCLLCFAETRTKLPKCLPAFQARIFLDGCFLRYDNYSFFDEAVDHKLDKVNCSSRTGVTAEEYMKSEFAVKVDEVIKIVTDLAVSNGGYGVGEVKKGVVSVYALAQCWTTLNDERCRTCLNKAGNNIRQCVPGKEGRGLNAGCYLRYSTEKFYNEAAEIRGDQRFSQTTLVVAITLSAMGFSMLALFGACLGYRRLSSMKQARNNLGRLSSAVNKSNLNFKYETLERATDFFNSSKKVGQGGAGSVFKGTLPDGRTVAVKRLFFNTRQWVDEFFNEVNLISGIQHKNLVRLLGCSIEGPESLLVYEYVPNKSLDQFLFDKNKTQILSWQQRFDIIVGAAEGLAFLHGGSEIRIIHRDIKCSNILLDENLTAKIADFGLARCFSPEKTHLSTGIAGTLGYMAPEYLVRGHLTEKADVYSYGVLILEIVCGRKNNVFIQDSGSLLQTVWKHYKSHKLPETVDPSLAKDFPAKEASNVLQVGLLCTQASFALRPSMAEVVQMLTNKQSAIPLPKQPPFLNKSVLSPETSDMSFSMNHSASNEHTTIEMSYNSIKSSIMTSPASDARSTIEISEAR